MLTENFISVIYEHTEYIDDSYPDNFYLYGANSLIEINFVSSSSNNIAYALTGVQDSIIVEVDAVSTTLSQEYSYDAWGRRRDKDTWQYTLSGEPELLAGRGFTAHEELPWFNLVNMNGRLYDPTVGRFLSADPVVQSPANTQNFNRYSYCLNNPLKYTDPSGYRIAKFMREDSEDDMYDETQDGGGLWSKYDASTFGGRGGRITGLSIGGGYKPPGFGMNGKGYGGMYYDWYSNTYRSTDVGNDIVSLGTVLNRLDSYSLKPWGYRVIDSKTGKVLKNVVRGYKSDANSRVTPWMLA